MKDKMMEAELRSRSKIPVSLKNLLTGKQEFFGGQSLFKNYIDFENFVKTLPKISNAFSKLGRGSVKGTIGNIVSGKRVFSEKFHKGLKFVLEERLKKIKRTSENGSRFISTSLAKHQELFVLLKNKPELSLLDAIDSLYGSTQKSELEKGKEIMFTKKECELMVQMCFLNNEKVSFQKIETILYFTKEI